MATFAQLYGLYLDRELASADTSKLFTTARRKAAINDGQREFIKQTECLTKLGSIAIVDGTAEYDLEASLTDYTWITKQGVEIARTITATSAVSYIAGPDDLQLKSVEWLNRNEPGWRSWAASTPRYQYLREASGNVYLGFAPAPDVPSTETWAISVPYVILPTDMSADADVPFTVSSNVKLRLWPWHQALVHWAASELEKLRKNLEAQETQQKRFAGYVADYLQRERPKGGQAIQMAHHYARSRQWGGVNVNRDFC
jgi:hypothetical protein